MFLVPASAVQWEQAVQIAGDFSRGGVAFRGWISRAGLTGGCFPEAESNSVSLMIRLCLRFLTPSWECFATRLLHRIWEPKTLGYKGVGKTQGPGHHPHFQPWAAVTRHFPRAPQTLRLSWRVLGQFAPQAHPWAPVGRSTRPASREPVQKVLLFSGPGMTESVLKPNRMWPGWLPTCSHQWLLFSDASRRTNPPATGRCEALEGSPGLMRTG